MAKGIVLTPKRKLAGVTGTIVEHITENTITKIETKTISEVVSFKWELKIPCGTDKYPGGHGA